LELQGLTADYYDNRDELQSFFGRVNYGIADKYLFTFTLRADGSSRFGPENRYGYFPSGAFAWKISEEQFIGPGVSTLKLRLSAGITGNQEGLGYGNYVARQRFSGLSINEDNSVIQNGLSIVATDVPDLKWETTTDFNIGLDWGFNLDRISGSIDVYRKETRDLLLQRPPAAPSTNPFIFDNVDATVINQGIELALAYDLVQTAVTELGVSFNISYNQNEIRDFFGTIPTARIWGPGLTGAFAQRFEAGQSLASFYMADFTGFDIDGNPTYRDIDGDGIGDNNTDKYFVGEDALPDVTSGLTFSFRHKNWIATASLYGQFGFSVYNNTANATFNAGQLAAGGNVTQNVLTSGENPSSSADVSTRFLQRGDFVRLQNASIGYQIPLPDTKTIKSLLLNMTGQNLFLITGYSGLDPEVNTDGANFLNGIPTAGMDYMAYPRPRVITFGVIAKF
jgi:iron complex outermembrane receptor protein